MRVSAGFIQASLSKNSRPFQGHLKTILQFSRIKVYEKILILVLKFYFRNAKLRYGRNLLKENKYKNVVPLFGAAYAAPNKGTTILY